MGIGIIDTYNVNITSALHQSAFNHLTEEDILALDPYWHDLVAVVASALLRGGFLAGETVLDAYGEEVIPELRWEAFIDSLYYILVKTFESEALYEIFSWDVQGKAWVEETVVLEVENNLPNYAGFKLNHRR